MRNWIVEQGWGMYIMIGMAAAGMIGSIICRLFYGRLAREAQICGTSDYQLLHYIRQKYSSYYKLGMQPSDAKALVRRYLSLHKVGLLPLNAYRYISLLMSGGIVMDGLIVALYRYQTTSEPAPSILYLGVSFVMALGLCLIRLLFGVENQRQIAENAVEDYLENYLKSKLDGEYGYSRQVTDPDNYENALKETAAARAGSRKNAVSSGQDYTSRNAGRSRRTDIKQPQVDAVDARIVEDVLKEFLC